MKAIRVHKFGGPEVLQLDDVADPKPGPGQVLVEIKAAGVNPVDTYIRSGAYAARYVAKNVVAAGLADRFEVQLAYAIGVAKPISISVETFGTGKVEDEMIVRLIDEHFDLRPGAIIRDLNLLGLLNPLAQVPAARLLYGEVAGWTTDQQIIWGTTIYNPQGQQIIWGTSDTTEDNQVIWGPSMTDPDPK